MKYKIKTTYDGYTWSYEEETFKEAIKFATTMYKICGGLGFSHAEDIDKKIQHGYVHLWWNDDQTRFCEIFKI